MKRHSFLIMEVFIISDFVSAQIPADSIYFGQTLHCNFAMAFIKNIIPLSDTQIKHQQFLSQ